MFKQLLTIVCLLATSQLTAQLSMPPSGQNQKSKVVQYMGSEAYVAVVYNSPDVTDARGNSRKGKIWGQLVPWGMAPNNFGSAKQIPWRAGANENTIVKFSHDMTVQGKAIKAGAYGLHIIPQENGPWTLIFSNNTSSWGSYFYNEAEDALRVEATPESTSYTEWLTFEFTDRQPTGTTLALKWDELALPFKIEVPDLDKIQLAKIEEELRSSKGFTWTNWNSAAGYAMSVKEMDKALEWADNAITAPFIGQANFTTLSTKAGILMQMGKEAEAFAVMDQAIDHPTASAGQVHQVGRQLLGMGKKDKALEIFEHNYKKFEKAWPTHVGMARGLSAVGKYKEALKHAEMAHEQAPDKLNKDALAASIEKLKKG
ncbi:MAG: DUF2911 domain-containing protein, partial [Bacteroidota bacterium]